jgi:hypothetical protein
LLLWFELGKYWYRKKLANIEEISYQMKKLVSPIPCSAQNIFMTIYCLAWATACSVSILFQNHIYDISDTAENNKNWISRK